MKLPRRTFLHLAASAAALPAVTRMAKAQTYPTRPVRVIIGFGPGASGDIAARVLQQFVRDERAAVASGEYEAAAKPLHVGGQIDHFGHVGEIVQREADRLGPKTLEFREQVAMFENLKVEYPDLMASRAHGGGYAFHPERFEAQVDFAVHERTWMYE